MKKLRVLLLILLSITILTACQDNDVEMNKSKELEKLELKVKMDIKPIHSYGNQKNQREQGDITNTYLTDGDNVVYATRNDCIIKFPAYKPEDQSVIYDFMEEESYPMQISVLGDWLYFILGERTPDDGEESNLYRMRKDGSGKKKLATDVDTYILTEEEVYYQKYYNKGKASLYVTSLDGKYERTLPKECRYLLGIDHGWIYYERGTDVSLFRMRPDGTGRDKVLALDEDNINAAYCCIVDNNSVYYVRNDEKVESKTYLIKKQFNGGETVLAQDSDFRLNDVSALNSNGEWLYYSMENKVYKIKVDGRGKRELVYQFKRTDEGGFPIQLSSIVINNDDVLLCAVDKKVCIKQDGTVVEMGKSLY